MATKTYTVTVLRVTGQTTLTLEGSSEAEVRERAVILSEVAIFGEPEHRRVAVIAGTTAGGPLAPDADNWHSEETLGPHRPSNGTPGWNGNAPKGA